MVHQANYFQFSDDFFLPLSFVKQDQYSNANGEYCVSRQGIEKIACMLL
jgi:hypothetical protein